MFNILAYLDRPKKDASAISLTLHLAVQHPWLAPQRALHGLATYPDKREQPEMDTAPLNRGRLPAMSRTPATHWQSPPPGCPAV